MKHAFLFMYMVVSMTASSQLSNKEVRDLKSGRLADDTSYVYALPYEKGESYLLVQGSNSSFSHKAELAYDFTMKEGSRVCAAREGVVTDIRGDSEHGGLKQENLSDGNYIYIQHADGSIASYWHLQKDGVLVQPGDKIEKGQVIGLSGNTGYSAFPHLHFQVATSDGRQVLVRFETEKGARYLKPGNWYRRP